MNSQSYTKFQPRRNRTFSDSESTVIIEPIEGNVSDDEESMPMSRIITLISVWCVISVLNSIFSKMLLNSFNYPLSSAFFQLMITSLCLEVTLAYLDIKHPLIPKYSKRFLTQSLFPLGFGKVLAIAGTHISLSKLPVSYAHTIKSTMPIFVIIITRLNGQKYALSVYVSLIVIFAGVAIASITELAFDFMGLVYGVGSTAAFAYINILTKTVLKESGFHQFLLLQVVTQLSVVMLLPVWLYYDFPKIMMQPFSQVSELSAWEVACLMLADGILHFAQNLVAFSLLAACSPLTYAVANVTKRVAVVLSATLVMSHNTTLANAGGMGMAITGVLLYNLARQRSTKSPKVQNKSPPKASAEVVTCRVIDSQVPPCQSNNNSRKRIHQSPASSKHKKAPDLLVRNCVLVKS